MPDAELRRAYLDAFETVADAVARCAREDVRNETVLRALDYLHARAWRTGPYERLRSALDIEDAQERLRNAQEAFAQIQAQTRWG